MINFVKIRIFILALISMLFVMPQVSFSQIGTSAAPDLMLDDEKKEKKKRNSFKVFAGVTINQLMVSEELYESMSMPGFDLGFAYKQGKFFYWEIGARYNNYVYDLKPVESYDTTLSTDFGVRVIDVPITGGINFTSFVSRILGVRVFVSAIPAFTLSMGENAAGLTKDNTNGFNFHAQGGVGIDVAFIFLEAGYNYGISDFIQNDVTSNPSQIFVNLGFRF